MENIIFVKRTQYCQLRTNKNPVIKLELKNARFIVSDIVAKILKVDNNDGLMFGFNQKEKTAYVLKDDEADAFILKRKDAHSLRFSSRDLMQYFDDTFGLLESGKSSFLFKIDKKGNNKGLHKIYL